MKTEIASLAAGCFWGVEELFTELKGVKNTQVGYSGGKTKDPNYEMVKTGDTGHAEAIQIEFNPNEISFEEVLHYFFRLHDPTTKNRQGNDIGSQYRSVIFYHDERQKEIAEKIIKDLENEGKWQNPIVTELLAFVTFYKAEDYHQNYLQKHPNGYTCHFLRD